VHPVSYGLRRHDGHREGVGKARSRPIADHQPMLGRLLNSQQQTDPKRRVKAQEHRRDIAMLAKPLIVPKIVE
jgi:hypothetical protein